VLYIFLATGAWMANADFVPGKVRVLQDLMEKCKESAKMTEIR
jgi:hypothetical protein